VGQKFRDEAGNVWEMDASGQPRLVTQGQAGPNVVVPAAQDPLAPYKLQQEIGQAKAAPFAAPKAQADATIAQANAGTAGVVAQAEATKAQADAQKAQAELAKLKEEQKKVDPKSGAYAALQQQIDRVTEIYRQNLQGGAPNIVHNLIPDFLQPKVDAFDSAAQGLVNPFMAAFKVPGQGSQSDTELKQFLSANTPAQGDSDEVIEEKIRNIQTRLNAEVPAKPEQTDKTPQLVAGGGQQPDRMGLSKDGFRDEIDPVLKGVAGRLGKMVSAGATDATIMEFLKKNGVDPANTNIQGVLQFRKSPDFKAWQRANPGKAYPIGPEFYTNQVPTSGLQDKVSAAVGSAPGAFALNYMQGVTGRHLDELGTAFGGNGEVVNTGTQVTQANNPTASFLGDLAGQATAQYGMTMLPGLRALPGSGFGRVGEDAIYGAFSGHGEGNTLGGAAANVLGGSAGRGLGAAGGVALRGVKPTDSLRYLNDAGVPLTVGQIGRGSNSTVGNAVGGIEERFAGLPIADAIIGSARRRGDEGFNAATFREMGGTGATGSRGVGEVQGLVNNAYNFLDTANLPLDAQFAGRNAMIRAGLPGLPRFGPEIKTSLDTIDSVTKGGSLSGRDWQSALRTTKGDRSSIRGKEFSDRAVSSLDEVESNLVDLAARQGPPGAAADLANANKLNMNFRTVVNALDNGPAQARGELFSPIRLDAAARATGRKYGGQVASMKGQRPFYDLTNAGMDVMPNLTPDSGTAGRSLFYASLPTILGGGAGATYGALSEDATAGQGAAAGASVGAMGTILPTLALSALYSKGGQKGLQKALLGPRPKWAKDLDKALAANPYLKHLVSKRAAGMFGSAGARDILLYPELDQEQ
jgi:hypothetical protein